MMVLKICTQMRVNVPAILRLTLNNALIQEHHFDLPADRPEWTEQENKTYRLDLVEYEAFLLRRNNIKTLLKLREDPANWPNNEPVIYMVVQNQLNDYDFENEA